MGTYMGGRSRAIAMVLGKDSNYAHDVVVWSMASRGLTFWLSHLPSNAEKNLVGNSGKVSTSDSYKSARVNNFQRIGMIIVLWTRILVIIPCFQR